jgi:hypothetical protein
MIHSALVMRLASTIGALAILALANCGDDTDEKSSSTSSSSNATTGTTTGSSSGGAGGAGGSTQGSGGSEGWERFQGQPCPPSGCPEPLQCVTYCGKAGCDNGMFTSCEIPCDPQMPMCPDGQICVTIADGPGDVCMPQ